MRVSPKAIAPALAALAFSTASQAAVQIVASIKPVELIVRAVATDDMQSTTLVPPGSSPHTYSMKPSERRALEEAEVIFWVGPEMETFLSRLVSGQEFRHRTVALMARDQANTGDDGHEHDDHDNTHREHADHTGDDNHGHDAQAHDDGHNHGDGEDPHIWLDPELAIEMAQTIHQSLSALEGVDTRALDSNLARFTNSVREMDGTIRRQLAPAHEISLFAYHNAFTRFAGHYDLQLDGVLTLNPELSPGARHIAGVQDKLRKANHPCLLTEPQFNRQWWRSITQGLNVTFSTWDPLATDVAVSSDGYNQFQQSIVDAVLKCLPEDTQHQGDGGNGQ
jgi:zinc transport system substrate-binding protein